MVIAALAVLIFPKGSGVSFHVSEETHHILQHQIILFHLQQCLQTKVCTDKHIYREDLRGFLLPAGGKYPQDQVL